MNTQASAAPTLVGHMIKGRYVEGGAKLYGPAHARFATPDLELNELVWNRAEPGPAFETPIAEVIDVLVETGQWLARDPDGLVADALLRSSQTSPLPYAVLKRSFDLLHTQFDRAQLEYQIEHELGGPDILDGWREMPTPPSGRRHRVRAYPPRIVHIVAGNAPLAAALTIAWSALTKGVHLLKLPSNDLFTATMLVRAISSVAPGHPTARSFTTAYWRGGDEKVESMLFRPQFFDKLAAWGGESTLRSAKNYVGPGFELVAFDPKTSISMIGREAFESDEALAHVAERAATDATLIEQQACASSRFQFVEGSHEQVDRYCALLHQRMGVERVFCTAEGSSARCGVTLRDRRHPWHGRLLSYLGRLSRGGHCNSLRRTRRFSSRRPSRQRDCGRRSRRCDCACEFGHSDRGGIPAGPKGCTAQRPRLRRRAACCRYRQRRRSRARTAARRLLSAASVHAMGQRRGRGLVDGVSRIGPSNARQISPMIFDILLPDLGEKT